MGKITKFFIAGQENNYHPPIISYQALLIYGVILLLVRVVLGALPAQSAAVESSSLMALVNQERSSRNLPGLFVDSRLVAAAHEKSQDMINRDYFAHVDPDGNYVWGRITKAGYSPYKILGENLAIDFATAEGMIKAWLDSPTHRANLLHQDFVDQGLVALFGDYEGRYTNLTTNLFGTLLVQPQRKPPASPVASPGGETAASQIIAPPPAYTYPTPVYPTPAASKPTTTPVKWVYVTPPNPVTAPPPPAGEPATALKSLGGFNAAYQWSRILFSIFGLFLLVILAIDSFIIYRHDLMVARSHSSYHFFGMAVVVLLSILIWWW